MPVWPLRRPQGSTQLYYLDVGSGVTRVLGLYRRKMAYPIRHKLLTVFGSSWGGAEEWSYSVRIIPETSEQDVTQAQVDALATPTSTFWNDTGCGMPVNYLLEGIKLAPIATDGNYPPDEISYTHLFTADPGPASTVVHPPQIAYAVTLTTSAPRGRGSKGRFYVPAPGFAVGSTGKITTGYPPAIMAAARTWILAINSATNVGTVGVLSSLGSGTSRVVAGLRAGVVLDTQRRRRNHLSEDYQSLAI